MFSCGPTPTFLTQSRVEVGLLPTSLVTEERAGVPELFRMPYATPITTAPQTIRPSGSLSEMGLLYE